MNLPAIPEPATFDRPTFEQAVPGILAWLDTVDELEVVLEADARSLALETYLAGRAEDVGPAQTVARMSEVRIGELLGPAEATNGRPLPAPVKGLHHARRNEFRLMAEWRTLVEERLPATREAVLKAIDKQRRRSIDAEARSITTLDADDWTGKRFALLAGTLRGRLGDLAEAGVDMVVTDPPYATEYMELWGELGEASAKVLKPQGILMALTGQIRLPEVMFSLACHLDWGWAYCQYMPGANSRILARHVGQAWKPWLAFSNGPWPSGRVDWHPDVLDGTLAKSRYRWEQSIEPAVQLVKTLCPEGGVVLDPFCGTGTYGLAALLAGRRFIGIEPDAERLALAAERLAEAD